MGKGREYIEKIRNSFSEAPNDGLQYGRQSEVWSKIPAQANLVGNWEFLADWDLISPIGVGKVRNIDSETADSVSFMFISSTDKDGIDRTASLKKMEYEAVTIQWYQDTVLVHEIINLNLTAETPGSYWSLAFGDPPNIGGTFDF